MAADLIRATYLVETPYPIEQAAEAIAGEQSPGTAAAVPGEAGEPRERQRASVESITKLDDVPAPSLPGSRLPPNPPKRVRYRRAEIVISFPLENVGASLTALLSTVAGNVFELSEVSGIRLMDIELPQAFAKAFLGPQFGVQGTRKL